MKQTMTGKTSHSGAWSAIFFGTGILAGLMLSVALIGMPAAVVRRVQADDLVDASLLAQVLSAEASWWMVYIGIISTCVGIYGLYLVLQTLAATRRAAVAAERSVSVARDIGQAQVRYYLTFSSVILKLETKNILKISFSVRNTGSSPAKDIAIAVRIFNYTLTADGDRRRNFSVPNSESGSWPASCATIAAQSSVTLSVIIPTTRPEYAVPYWPGTLEHANVEIEITATATDVFDARHQDVVPFRRWISDESPSQGIAFSE